MDPHALYRRYIAGAKTKERLDAMRAADSVQLELSVFEKALKAADSEVQNDIYFVLKKFQGRKLFSKMLIYA